MVKAKAAPVIVATPAVTRPGAGPSSAMVTRSRARGGREINVEPEVEFRPEIEFLPEVEIPAETDEEVSGATRHITDIASQYIPEVAITQEVTTSASITTSTLPIPRNIPLTPARRRFDELVAVLLFDGDQQLALVFLYHQHTIFTNRICLHRLRCRCR